MPTSPKQFLQSCVNRLSADQTEQALIELQVPRAANMARISLSLGL
jgi:hypothetical protein